MDERTLNDLLECSVCLERLDTSSKVLPCQHTFCRKCLEVIVSSRQELRCPECRILIEVKIDELPPNVLLMRILEGMKNSSHNQQNNSKSPKSVVNISANTGSKSSDINEHRKSVNSELPARTSNEQCNSSNRRIIPHAFALYDFVSTENGDLNFKKGDIIILKRKIDPNWFVGEINGREGAFPINYVQIIVPLPIPQCVALYDFKMGPNEEEGCLTFKKGAIINVIRRIDHNWAEGRINSCIGIFPIAFVEMNSLAKQLLESTNVPQFMTPRCLPPVPFESNSTDSSSTVTSSPNSTCSSNTSSNSAPSSPTSNSNSNSPQHNQTVIKNRDIKEKRHSLNSLTANTNLSMVSSNRHSAEILSVPDALESTSSVLQNPDSSTTLVTSANTHNDEIQSTSHLNQLQKNPRINILKTTSHQALPNLPWAYVALYPYKPRKSDELELKKGCVYFVTERCLDGWYKGRNWADKSGVFPGNYVTPLRSRDQQQVIHQRKLSNIIPHSQQLSSINNSTPNQPDISSSSTQPAHPPELPPRSNTITSTSVWTKPLGQHVEAFFHRKSSPGQQRNENNAPSNEIMKTPPLNSASNVSKEVSGHQQYSHNVTNREKDKKESNSSAVSLMKRLTNMKRSKSPPHSNQNVTYSMDNPVFEDTTLIPASSSSKHNISMSHPVHVRSGSCPSQLLQSLPIEMGCGSSSSMDPNVVYGSQRIKGHKERPSLQGIRQQIDSVRNRASDNVNGVTTSGAISLLTKPGLHKQSQQAQPQTSSNNLLNVVGNHRKSQSLDANTISSQITTNSPNTKSHGMHLRESRFRCIVSYPPNSDHELELNVGDIVFVHRKQKNGWYKGTHARTNKTGLFPASFVEPDI